MMRSVRRRHVASGTIARHGLRFFVALPPTSAAPVARHHHQSRIRPRDPLTRSSALHVEPHGIV
jgi:hypothetical protein